MKFRPTMKLAMAIAAAVATGSCLIAAPAKKEPTAAAPAQSRFDQGIAAGNRGDWQAAYRLWGPLAVQSAV